MTLKSLGFLYDAEILTDEPMKKHTSFGVGGNADYFVTVKSLCTLNNLVNHCVTERVPYKVIGCGTNLLVSDKGYRGVIISTLKLNDVFFKLDKVKAMSGATIQKLVAFSMENSLTGLEWFCGIPATVGGAITMNAGAFGHSISECVQTVETIKDGNIACYDKDFCRFSYRTSRFKNRKEPIVSVTFNLPRSDDKLFTDQAKRVMEVRKKLHPVGKTCGSVFKNPKKTTAGQLIDGAGLKGFRIGGASVSEKHANFIINDGTATANEIATLIIFIKTKVKKTFGVDLQEEVEYIGEF